MFKLFNLKYVGSFYVTSVQVYLRFIFKYVLHERQKKKKDLVILYIILENHGFLVNVGSYRWL